MPPKWVRHELMYRELKARGFDPDAEAPAGSANDSSLVPDQRTPPIPGRIPPSLPVLRAFQDFLRAERRKTRAQLVTVAGLLLFALIAIGSAFVVFGLLFYDQSQTSMETLRRSMDTVRAETHAGRSELLQRIELLSMDASRMAQGLEEDRRLLETLKNDLGKDRQFESLTQRLQDLLVRLERQQTEWQARLDALRTGLVAVATGPRPPPAFTPLMPAAGPGAEVARPTGEPAPFPRVQRRSEIVVPVQLPGQPSEPIALRMLLPE